MITYFEIINSKEDFLIFRCFMNLPYNPDICLMSRYSQWLLLLINLTLQENLTDVYLIQVSKVLYISHQIIFSCSLHFSSRLHFLAFLIDSPKVIWAMNCLYYLLFFDQKNYWGSIATAFPSIIFNTCILWLHSTIIGWK